LLSTAAQNDEEKQSTAWPAAIVHSEVAEHATASLGSLPAGPVHGVHVADALAVTSVE
jgi:hypothetical protein